MQRSKDRRYSITSSARASSIGGTVRPSALAPPLGRYSAANVITWKEMRESSTSALAAPT
jgi:hypothetical protein